MFEREIRDASFVVRWGIVRTLRQQSLADHTFMVAMYANDIVTHLGLPDRLKLAVLQMTLWHDVREEIFTGDIPGPPKRAIVDKPRMKSIVGVWSNKVFSSLEKRDGTLLVEGYEHELVECIVKLADNLDAACELATEIQLGNQNAKAHLQPNINRCADGLVKLEGLLKSYDAWKADPQHTQFTIDSLKGDILGAVLACMNDYSRGPLVSEDA